MASEWDLHKNEITLLYLVEGLKLNDVSSRMLQRHGFDKKKHQYEYFLKKWKVSKNTKREMWEYVDHILRKRQTQQKVSEVRLRGVVLPDSRVRKATQRYGRRSLAAKFHAAASPQSPGGQLILIASPPDLSSQISLPEDLPWTCFARKFKLVHHHISELSMELVGLAMASRSIILNSKDTDNAIRTIFRLPVDWRATLCRQLSQFDPCSDGLVRSSHPQEANVTTTKALKTLLFQISNHNISVKHALMAENMMKLFHQLSQEVPEAVLDLIASTDPTSAAIKETFFPLAVRFGQSSLVLKFLDSGTDPNTPIAHHLVVETDLRRDKAWLVRKSSIQRATPLQIACATGDYQTARVLLENKARPDFGTPTPLQITSSLAPSSDCLRLAQLLLEHDVQVDTTQIDVLLPPLMEAVACGNTQMVRLLIDKGAMDRIVHTKLSAPPFMITPGHLPFYFPGQPAEEPYDHVGICLYENHPTITALQIAIVVNDLNIIEMLLLAMRDSKSRADIYNRGLVTACLASDELMVRRILSLNTAIRDDKSWINAAFCAMAGSPDCGIARLLLESQIVPQWHESLCISAIQLAALHGNDTLLAMLHSCQYDVNACKELILFSAHLQGYNKWLVKHQYPLDARPLEYAIRFKHSQTVQMLLHFGADLTDRTINMAIAFGNDEVVIQSLAGGLNASNQSQEFIQLAVQKGKGLTFIRKLVDAGAAFRGDELVAAVQEDAQEVVEYFLACGLNILASDAKGVTVLIAAAQVGNLDMMYSYFKCGGHYSSKALFRAVASAIATGDQVTVELLIQHRPPGPMDTYESTSFVQSIWEGNGALIDLFLDLDASPSTSYFCLHNDDEDLQLPQHVWTEGLSMVSKEPCYNGPCNSRISPMWAAAYMDEETLLEDMISRNYPPDAFLLKSALYNLSFASQEVREKLITAYPISSSADQAMCRNLLREAIFAKIGVESLRRHINSVQNLEFISRDECVDNHGTPLQLAATHGTIDCVRALLDAGSHVNAAAEGIMGQSALQGAVLYNRFDITMLLLEDGADVNGLPSPMQGMTAIEVAAYRGLLDMTVLLLPHVALHGPMRIHFVRAVSYAEQECHHVITELLKNHGGWTTEDREIAATSRGHSDGHTCPRFLYNDESWDGECEDCDYFTNVSKTSPASTSSDANGCIVPSNIDLMEVEATAVESGVNQLSTDENSTIVFNRSEDTDYSALESAATSLYSYDSTTRWLDDLAREFVDNLV